MCVLCQLSGPDPRLPEPFRVQLRQSSKFDARAGKICHLWERVQVSSALRAVFLDAVGTLIHPAPSAAEVYATAARRRGSRLSAQVIATRFRAAMAREDEVDRAAGWRTSERREAERWRRIVAAVLDDVDDPEGCFQELWQHFSRPQAWRHGPAVAAVLEDLTGRNLIVGIASNFDARLRRVLAGLPALRAAALVVISSEVGWRKPAGEFFAALLRTTGLSGDAVLMAGDDPTNDFEGARAAGLRALLLDDRVARLADLPRLLDGPREGVF
jgi:putative hydrolase of the HAD superfamily